MAALHLINLYERNDIERQRLPKIVHRHLPWEGFSDEELIKRYRFGRESLLFIPRFIQEEVKPTTQRNHAISTEEQLVIALRFLASGTFFQVIGSLVKIVIVALLKRKHVTRFSQVHLKQIHYM